jgi:hypothetical protein
VSSAARPRSLARFALEVLGFTVVLFALWYAAARCAAARTRGRVRSHTSHTTSPSIITSTCQA